MKRNGRSDIMREQIKELCLFMICGQTLLHFQSGKKYEKICRMILELLVLAGIVGMILNFLQSLGIQKGDMPAAGGAVANMQRSMEEALLKQLDMDSLSEEFMSGISMEGLVEKYTLEEMKTKYNDFAGQYGFAIENIKQEETKLQVFVKKTGGSDEGAEGKAESKAAGGEEKEERKEIARISPVEVEKIDIGGEEKAGEEAEDAAETEKTEKEAMQGEAGMDQDRLELFRRQLALVFAMEEEKLEVILID